MNNSKKNKGDMHKDLIFQIKMNTTNITQERDSNLTATHFQSDLKPQQSLKSSSNEYKTYILLFIIIGLISLICWYCFRSRKQNKKHNSPKKQNKAIRHGLPNIGNSCYLNSSSQCLFASSQLIEEMKRKQFQESHHLKNTFLDVNKQVSSRNASYYSLQTLKSLITQYNSCFQGNHQQDPSQYLVTFFALLHQEMNQTSTEKNSSHLIKRPKQGLNCQLWRFYKNKDENTCKSIVDQIIFGRFKTVYKCKCRATFTLFQKFSMVYLPIPHGKNVKLADCIEQFNKIEKLQGENAIFCSQCQQGQSSEKQITFFQTNKILILCLRRFDFDAKKKQEKRIKVDFTLNLEDVEINPTNSKIEMNHSNLRNIEPYNKVNRSVYDLYAMINHRGTSIQSGHYTATCCQKERWFRYSDTFHKQIDKSEVVKDAEQAYILFYRFKEHHEKQDYQ